MKLPLSCRLVQLVISTFPACHPESSACRKAQVQISLHEQLLSVAGADPGGVCAQAWPGKGEQGFISEQMGINDACHVMCRLKRALLRLIIFAALLLVVFFGFAVAFSKLAYNKDHLYLAQRYSVAHCMPQALRLAWRTSLSGAVHLCFVRAR